MFWFLWTPERTEEYLRRSNLFLFILKYKAILPRNEFFLAFHIDSALFNIKTGQK